MFADLILVVGIVASGILFITVNMNYIPDDADPDPEDD